MCQALTVQERDTRLSVAIYKNQTKTYDGRMAATPEMNALEFLEVLGSLSVATRKVMNCKYWRQILSCEEQESQQEIR